MGKTVGTIPTYVSDVLFTYEKQKASGLRIYEEKVYLLWKITSNPSKIP